MSEPTEANGITLTDAAADRVRNFLSRTDSAVGMRLGVRKVGCSGMAYVVDLADAVGEKDKVYETNGIKIIIDEKSLPYVKGTRIDFTSDGLNESFYYDNPNIKSLCGCGESFGI